MARSTTKDAETSGAPERTGRCGAYNCHCPHYAPGDKKDPIWGLMCVGAETVPCGHTRHVHAKQDPEQ